MDTKQTRLDTLVPTLILLKQLQKQLSYAFHFCAIRNNISCLRRDVPKTFPSDCENLHRYFIVAFFCKANKAQHNMSATPATPETADGVIKYPLSYVNPKLYPKSEGIKFGYAVRLKDEL